MNSAKNPNQSRWEQIVSAAKAAPSSADTAAPYGFATRTAALWKEARRTERFRLWERWSLRAGAASLAFCAVCAIGSVIFPSQSSDTLIQVPSLDLSLTS